LKGATTANYSPVRPDVELGPSPPPVTATSPMVLTTAPSTESRGLPRRRVHITASAMYSIQMLSILLDCMENPALIGAHTTTTTTTTTTHPFDDDHAATNKVRRHCSSTLGDNRAKPRHSRRQSLLDELQNMTMQDVSASVVQSIASIPDLVQIVLYVEDSIQRKRLLETTLMRRVLSSTYSIGSWLTGMIQSHEARASHLALDYLHLVSSDALFAPEAMETETKRKVEVQSMSRFTTNTQLVASSSTPHQLREEFYHEVSRLQDFVPSLLSLNEKQIEEAATTKIVQQVLDRVISRPFAVMVIFCDALFLALLIYGYRRAVNGVLLGRARGTILSHVFVTNIGTFYFVQREIGKAISLYMISRRRVRVYWTVWNVIDLLATFLSLSSTVALRLPYTPGLRTLYAITTGFMWLRVLSYLKGINMQLATFVLAILQVRRMRHACPLDANDNHLTRAFAHRLPKISFGSWLFYVLSLFSFHKCCLHCLRRKRALPMRTCGRVKIAPKQNTMYDVDVKSMSCIAADRSSQ
jgi:hypothetical protein